MNVTFEYGRARVRDLAVQTGGANKSGLPKVRQIELDGRRLAPTRRFWKSFFGRFQTTENIFRYFSHEEVFQRISQVARDETFRYCIERRPRGDDRLLAVTNPARPVIAYDEIKQLVETHEAEDCQYQGGVVTSRHTPRSGEHALKIGGDEFKHRYVLDVPVDGYGMPRIHLAMLRMICSNGMVGYSKAFRSEISAGKDVAYGITRALKSFDNENGYSALRQRLDSAQKSWASIRETQDLYRVLLGLEGAEVKGREAVMREFYEVTGRVHELYGLANLDALSGKRQRVLPAKCKVYDLINFASELATHHTTAANQRSLQGYIGELISDEYDLEGTAERVSDFHDFFVSDN